MSARISALAIGLLLIAVSGVAGQYAADQAKSLEGIQVIVVNFAEPNQKMDPDLRQEMFDAVSLELRKTGIRIIRGDAPQETADALLNLTVSIATGLTDFVNVRMDIEQKATVVRTGETLQLVTWFYEESQNQGSWRSTAHPMAIKAANQLISDWLDANNR